MKCVRTVILVLTCLATAQTVRASDYPVDLATHPGGEVTASISPGRIRAVIHHRVPGHDYSVSIVLETIPVPPLANPAGVPLVDLGQSGAADCAKLKSDAEKIPEPQDEPAVGRAAEAIEALLKGSKCEGPIQQAVKARFEAYDKKYPLDEYVVEVGQRLRITVERPDAKKTWTTILTTVPRGEWLTTYGMTFLPMRDQLFFSKAGDTQGKYVVTRQRDEADSGIRFLPSVLFSWMPASRKGKDLAFSPTAGFGATSGGFGVLAGGTVTYNSNLGVTVGVAVAQQKRLLGKYKEGDTISENLTEDQLHHRVLKPAAFVSITFRFASNPFKDTAEQPAKPKDDTTPVKASPEKNEVKKE